jgi:hypothetical protein
MSVAVSYKVGSVFVAAINLRCLRSPILLKTSLKLGELIFAAKFPCLLPLVLYSLSLVFTLSLTFAPFHEPSMATLLMARRPLFIGDGP